MSIEHSGLPESPKASGEKYDFSNGATLKSNRDMPFLGVKKDQVIKVNFDGQYLRIGPLSWSKEQLADEIDQGVWTLEETI